MEMQFSKDYWFVHQLSPTCAFLRWEKENPRPIGASKKRREAYWAKEREAKTKLRAIFDDGRAKLKAAGLNKQRDFPADQEAQARAYAAKVTEQTGVEMVVAKGFYIGL